MKIASWNVNSIAARLEHTQAWLKQNTPDVLLLQELKGVEEQFPTLLFQELGYHTAVLGQKTYNGVAILSRLPFRAVRRGIPNYSDEAARYIEADLENGFTIASVYVPNGESLDSEKYTYKKSFYRALTQHMKTLFESEKPVVVGGDFNVAAQKIDVYTPDMGQRIMFSQEERRLLQTILNQGWVDSFRAKHPETQAFSWWDYREGSWPQNKGWRIDYVLASPEAMDQTQSAGIDPTPRGWEKPSDHVPVWVDIR